MMVKKSNFPRAAMAAAILSALMLAFLFIVPSSFLLDTTSALREDLTHAKNAALSDDVSAAHEPLSRMEKLFDARINRLKLFFHHDDLDELDCALDTALALVSMGERDNLMGELSDMDRVIEHMESVEGFNIYEIF